MLSKLFFASSAADGETKPTPSITKELIKHSSSPEIIECNGNYHKKLPTRGILTLVSSSTQRITGSNKQQITQ